MGVTYHSASPPLPHPSRLTELHDENAVPYKGLETLQYRSQREGQDNFILSYPGEQDTPNEGSEFSEFEHLDSEDGGEEDEAYYLDRQQEFVVVDDMTKLVEPDEEDLTDFRHSVPDDWFDDPAYAQINTLHNQQEGGDRGRHPTITHSYTQPPLPFPSHHLLPPLPTLPIPSPPLPIPSPPPPLPSPL